MELSLTACQRGIYLPTGPKAIRPKSGDSPAGPNSNLPGPPTTGRQQKRCGGQREWILLRVRGVLTLSRCAKQVIGIPLAATRTNPEAKHQR